MVSSKLVFLWKVFLYPRGRQVKANQVYLVSQRTLLKASYLVSDHFMLDLSMLCSLFFKCSRLYISLAFLLKAAGNIHAWELFVSPIVQGLANIPGACFEPVVAHKYHKLYKPLFTGFVTLQVLICQNISDALYQRMLNENCLRIQANAMHLIPAISQSSVPVFTVSLIYANDYTVI